ncbi:MULTISPECIES: hypothetical protein [unclassified Sphingobacterium]|uniref:hypothetical protein n=1 Tax=unclassified Sphingobacterium TaxID=2609468 RepID=UPI0025D19FCC|nr:MULTISPECIES: hypothetical protein [unclassified Sphingobacterium]
MMEPSSKFRNILFQEPNWFLRSGNLILLLVVIMLLTLTAYIKEPDIVRANGFFLKESYIEEVRSRNNGEIVDLFYQEDDWVKPNDVIATLQGSADFKSVKSLIEDLKHVIEALRTKDYNLDSILLSKNYDNLGELQILYEEYLAKYSTFKANKKSGIESIKEDLNRSQSAIITEGRESIKRQIGIIDEKIQLQQLDYDSYKKLFERKIISPMEFRARTKDFLDLKNQKINLEVQLLNNQDLSERKIFDIYQIADSKLVNLNSFFNSTLSLESQLQSYVKDHSLVSHGGGKLIFGKDVRPGYLASVHETIFFVDPFSDSTNFHLELRLGTSSFGKIKKGQSVRLSMPAYPYQEFGYLEAKITYLPGVTIHDSTYRARAELVGDCKNCTSFGKSVGLKHGLFTEAQIITNDKTILEKIFQNFRSDF